jgi:hypothetical protein
MQPDSPRPVNHDVAWPDIRCTMQSGTKAVQGLLPCILLALRGSRVY